MYYLKLCWLHLMLLSVESAREQAFDRCRDTGGESSPYLEVYQEYAAEQANIQREIADLRASRRQRQ